MKKFYIFDEDTDEVIFVVKAETIGEAISRFTERRKKHYSYKEWGGDFSAIEVADQVEFSIENEEA